MNCHNSDLTSESPFSLIFRVIIQATPGLNVAAVAMATSDEASLVQGKCDSGDGFSTPPLNFELFARDGFDISWCQYVVRLKFIVFAFK